MIVDELILKLQADLSDVKKKLKDVEGQAAAAGKEAGAKMGKEMGTSFADVFQAIAGAAILNSVKSFYARAAQEFNKFEAAFLRVDSIAKGFGRSVDVARKQVEQLADKGFLNLNQAASSYADAIALGFDEKQARKFIDSLSDIAAFQNTIGDGAAAVQSGLAGLLSNSAEKVENIGVPVKVLNMAYNENIKTMGKAAALQKFYNGILKESEKFQGDAARAVDTLAGAQNKANAATDKAMVAIGKGLEPTLKKLYNTIEDLALGFTKWFSSLDSTTKTVILMVPVIGALVIAFGALLPILKAISLSNPFGWVAAAISGLGALVVVIRQLNSENIAENIVKGYKDTAKALKEVGDRSKELEAIHKRTAEQEKELTGIKEGLRKKARELGVDYETLAKSAKNAADMTQMLTNIERERAAGKLREQLTEIQRKRAAVQGSTYGGATPEQAAAIDMARQFQGGLSRGQLDEAFAAQEKEITQGLVDIYQQNQTGGSAAQAAAAAGSKANEARFIESQAKLIEIEKNRLFTIRNISKKISEEEQQRQRDNADKDANYQRESVINSLRQTFAEYIEDKRSAELNALQESTLNAKRASEEQLTYELNLAGKNEKLIQQAKEDNRKRLAEIDKANARKQAVIEAESVNQTLQAAQAAASGFSQASKAKDVGGFLGGLGGMSTGLSKISPELEALGPLGSAMGAIGGITSTIAGLFGKSDEERAREAAEAQRVREEQLKILELQANYQKSMLALQEAAAKLPFENLQRQLRLIDIESQQAGLQGGDANAIENTRLSRRQAAIQQTLTSQSGAIGGGQLFGGVGSSPDELIGFLSERGAESLAVQQFASLFGSLSSDVINRATGDAQIAQLASYRGKVPPALMAVFDDYVSKRNALLAEIDAERTRLRPTEVQLGTDWLNTQLSNVGNPRLANILSGSLSGVNALGSEISADTGIAENLLSTLEQSLSNQKAIKDATEKTADNTAKALDLRPDRERSFIDVGQGFIQSLGQRITAPSAIGIARSVSQNLSLPSELGAATVISGRARTLQERMADALETQIRQGATANELLRQLLEATLELQSLLDSDAGTSPTSADQIITGFLSRSAMRRY